MHSMAKKSSSFDRTLQAIITRAADEVAAAVRQNIADEVRRLVGARAAAAGKEPRPSAKGAKKAKSARPSTFMSRPCPYPGCTNPTRGPRFSWFCAEHRELPKEERERVLS